MGNTFVLFDVILGNLSWQVQHLALSTEKYRRYINICYYYLLLLLFLLFTLEKSVTDKKFFPMGNSYLSMRKIAVCFKSNADVIPKV